MKQLNQYIIEKFKINSKTVTDQNEKNMDYKSFCNYIKELFDINDKEDFDHMIRCFSTYMNVDAFPKSKFELIDKEHKSYEHIGNVCADLINHPSKYKKLSSIDILYSSVTSKSIDTELRIFLYKMDDGSQFLCFLDYTENKFYIFEYEEH